MTYVGLIFIVLGITLSATFAMKMRSGIYIALFFVHLAAAVFYWQFTLYRVADAWGYYNFSHATSEFAPGPGTWFVGWLTWMIRAHLDASYLDTFMIYHITGYVGIVAFHQVCCELFVETPIRFRLRELPIHMIMFLPSLNIWTSVVGKDSLMFLGTMAFVWGASKPSNRLWACFVGSLICFSIRPHVAALLIVSSAVAVTTTRHTSFARKSLMIGVLAVLLMVAVPYAMEYVGLRGADTGSITTYIEARQDSNLDGGSSVDISEYSFPMQFFTFMYRPLFFDAGNALAVMVSFENTLFLLASIAWGPAALRAVFSGNRTFFGVFNFVFWALSTSLFAMTTSNLGLAVRQKTAFLPSFMLLILGAYTASRVGPDADSEQDADEDASAPSLVDAESA